MWSRYVRLFSRRTIIGFSVFLSAFGMDDPLNQFSADMYGIVMGTRYAPMQQNYYIILMSRSHQEPMMRSTPNEFSLVGEGPWDYVSNKDNIYNYWLDGARRAKPYESVFTLGMRGFGDRKGFERSYLL